MSPSTCVPLLVKMSPSTSVPPLLVKMSPSTSAHYWLNKGYIELYENGGKIWFTSSPSGHNPNSISKLECVLTLFYVPWFLREHTHTQKWLKFWHCPKLFGALFYWGEIYLYFYRVITGGIRRVLYDFPSVHCIFFEEKTFYVFTSGTSSLPTSYIILYF